MVIEIKDRRCTDCAYKAQTRRKILIRKRWYILQADWCEPV